MMEDERERSRLSAELEDLPYNQLNFILNQKVGDKYQSVSMSPELLFINHCTSSVVVYTCMAVNIYSPTSYLTVYISILTINVLIV